MSDLVRNPEDRFSHIAAHIIIAETVSTILLQVYSPLSQCYVVPEY